MSLAPRTRLGPYEITAKLGEGGMGEVYRAKDTKLGREVAIKVLPTAFSEDRERLARFEREAQVLAQLHHPNIASIFGLEESEGVRALVMELVEGPTLAERLESGPLPLDEGLSIARQIAEALEEAHEKGIVHRDLKPANVKLTAEGKVKVLDFGLAKALDPVGAATSSASQLAKSPTLTAAGTQMGVILGTAAYMSPEQAKGMVVDKRADIWAFGVVLYEILAGRRLFEGDSVPETLAGVLKTEIEWSALPDGTPAALSRLLRRCLERKPKNRLHDIADARIEIDDLLSGRAATDDEQPKGDAKGVSHGANWPARLAWLGTGLALGALAIAGFGRALFEAEPARPPIVRSLTYSGTSDDASISPDGRNVAFVSGRDGTPRIWLKQLVSGEEVVLTEGRDFGPQISPDSSSVLFRRAADPELDLFRVPLIGGEPRRLARNIGSADWSPDGGQIAFARDLGHRSQLILIPADGGAERVLLERDGFLSGVAWSPNGAQILVMEGGRVNTISSRVLATVDVPSGSYHERYRLPAGSLTSAARWDGDDALLFAWSPTQARRGEILLQRLELGSTTPRAVFSFTSLPERIELAGRGALVFDGGGAHQNLVEVGDGPALGRALTSGPTRDRQPAFSPDGRRVVFSSDRSGSLDLWSAELATRAVRRLTFDTADDWDPHWSADGKHLVWSSNRSGHFEIWIAEPDGSGARQVTSDGFDAENPTMSLDGSWIVYSSANPTAPGIWGVHPDGSGATRLLAGNFTLPELAPKSDWIATVETGARSGGAAPIRVIRLEDGATVVELSVPGQFGNTGRSRWMPDGRTLVSLGGDDVGRAVLYRQPIVPGRDTRAQRQLAAASDERRWIESFGVSPVDGRIVVSAGWGESDVLLAEGIPSIGTSLRKRKP